MTKNLRRSADQRRANLIEMAMVFFLLLLLLAGVADLGRAFHHYIVITNAAREGARYSSHFPKELSCWLLNNTGAPITLSACIGGDNSRRAAAENEVDARIGDAVSAAKPIMWSNSAVLLCWGIFKT